MQKMVGKYDKAIAEKTVNKIKKEFDSFYMGPVIERVTTSSSGGVSTDYYSDCTAISKNYVYSVKLFFMTDRCYLSTFTEEDMNKFNYPKDIVEFAIKNASGKNSLLINKKYIKIVDVDSSIFNRNINPEVSAIQKYVESKHKDLTFNIKPNTIAFK